VFRRRRAPVPAPDRARHQAEIVRRVGRKKSLTFALWNEFKPPPYGGGNQFMIALEGALRRKGMQVARMGTHDRNARHMPGARWQIAADRGTIRNLAATGLVSSGPPPAGGRARAAGRAAQTVTPSPTCSPA